MVYNYKRNFMVHNYKHGLMVCDYKDDYGMLCCGATTRHQGVYLHTRLYGVQRCELFGRGIF